MSDVIVVIGAGAIGQAVARRIGAGRQIMLADLRRETAESVAGLMNEAGFEVHASVVDVTSRASVEALAHEASGLGEISGLIHSAGVSPSSATPELILRVDLYGTAVVLDVFGSVIAAGGCGLVVSSQAGYRLPAWPQDKTRALATTPADELLALPMLQPEQITDPLVAYQIAKRGASLRAQAESVRWARREARLNAISPGIVATPLARNELSGPGRQTYQRMIDTCAAGRTGTPDEIAGLGALLMGPEGQFISGSDFLMDGGVSAAYWWGDLTEAY
ncbi:MAG: SDR family oxidoreductase [Wenzhouxiangella sp.]|jgi:NAD(P)-dependent dehydrogenase (short-subunit alcohol dehydrogenase family)|nr:SDR family oxidoreductase [Wenzhouxiangella sp.]